MILGLFKSMGTILPAESWEVTLLLPYIVVRIALLRLGNRFQSEHLKSNLNISAPYLNV
jgi:hypothetical protein